MTRPTLLRSPRVSFTAALLLLLLGPLGLTACNREGADGQAAAKGPQAQAADADAIGAAIDAAVAEEVPELIVADRRKACELLPAGTVAKTLGIPEAELKQMKIGGCIYTWKSADRSETGEASILSVFVSDEIPKAERRFTTTTTNRSAEELRAQMASITTKAKEREEIDSATKEKAVDDIGGMIGAMMPEGGHIYEDVPGVGDAARILVDTSSLTVRVRNLVFTVNAYKGPTAPGPDLSGIRPGDMQVIIDRGKAAAAEWQAETREQRREQTIELARAIVAGL